jgi:Na+/proline symporter
MYLLLMSTSFPLGGLPAYPQTPDYLVTTKRDMTSLEAAESIFPPGLQNQLFFKCLICFVWASNLVSYNGGGTEGERF